ncbi:MAG: DUF3168 domain-containing protein [Actinomycetota bacterium]
MSIEETLFTRLSTHAGLIALVAARIYPLVAPEGVAAPFVIYQRISTRVVHAMSTDPSLESPRFQVSARGSSYASAKTVETQILAALRDYTDATIQRAFYENKADLYEPDTKLYHIPVDFIIWHI